MTKLLGDLLGICALVYIDDIIIFSSSLEEHFKHVTLVFDRLEKHNLKLGPDKCDFF